MSNNLLKISGFIGIIVISSSIGYYFFFFLPQYKQESLSRSLKEQELEKQIECQKVGSALNEKELDGIDTPLVPAFKFSKNLNTCLYKGGYITANPSLGSGITWFIKDAYSNKEIISYTSFAKNGKTDDIVGSRIEFERQEKELFGE